MLRVSLKIVQANTEKRRNEKSLLILKWKGKGKQVPIQLDKKKKKEEKINQIWWGNVFCISE